MLSVTVAHQIIPKCPFCLRGVPVLFGLVLFTSLSCIGTIATFVLHARVASSFIDGEQTTSTRVKPPRNNTNRHVCESLVLRPLPSLDSPSLQNPYISHHRQRSSATNKIPQIITSNLGTTSGKFGSGIGRILPTIPGTPVSAGASDMSLSRSPSPQSGGGWSSPGLTTPYDGTSRRASPARPYANGSANNVTWATAQARSAQVRAFTPGNQGFSRHFRKFSNKLPYFNARDYSEKEKLGRGRPSASNPYELLAFVGRVAWRVRQRFAIALLFLLLLSVLNLPCECYRSN